MRNFNQSSGPLAWAMSLFGLGGLADLLEGRGRVDVHAPNPFSFPSENDLFENPTRFVFQTGGRFFNDMLNLLLSGAGHRCGCETGGEDWRNPWSGFEGSGFDSSARSPAEPNAPWPRPPWAAEDSPVFWSERGGSYDAPPAPSEFSPADPSDPPTD